MKCLAYHLTNQNVCENEVSVMHAGFPLCRHHYGYLKKYKEIKVVYQFKEPLKCTLIYLHQKMRRVEQHNPWTAIQEREKEIARSDEGDI